MAPCGRAVITPCKGANLRGAKISLAKLELGLARVVVRRANTSPRAEDGQGYMDKVMDKVIWIWIRLYGYE